MSIKIIPWLWITCVDPIPTRTETLTWEVGYWKSKTNKLTKKQTPLLPTDPFQILWDVAISWTLPFNMQFGITSDTQANGTQKLKVIFFLRGVDCGACELVKWLLSAWVRCFSLCGLDRFMVTLCHQPYKYWDSLLRRNKWVFTMN